MSGRRQDRIPAPADAGAGGRNEGRPAPTGTRGSLEDGRGGSTTNARHPSADADVMQDVSSVAVPPRGSVSSVPTVVPPARNVVRRLADTDEDWAIEGPIEDNVRGVNNTNLEAGEGRGADTRAAPAPLVEAPAEPAPGLDDEDAARARQEDARLRTAASLVGSRNAAVATDLEDVDHYWHPYGRSNFRVSEMFSKCDERTTDMRMLGRLVSSMDGGPWSSRAPRRYETRFNDRVQVPPSLVCDRTFLFEADDAKYVDSMDAFLAGIGSNEMPLLSFLEGTSIDRRPSQGEKVSTSLAAVTDRIITADDYFVVRWRGAESDRVVQNTRLLVPLDTFPTVPMVMKEHPWPLGLPMQLPRVLRYFGRTSENFLGARKERYEEAVRCEYVIQLILALYQEIRDHRFVWQVDPATLSLIAEWRERYAFPTVNVVGGRSGEIVDISLVVRLVTELPQLREAFRSSRVDYPTNRDVVYAEVDGEFRFCVPGATRRPHRNRGQKREQRDGDEPMPDVKQPRSTVTHGVTWGSVMTDGVLRSNDEMKEIFKEESERRAGWTLGEVFSVINRRYGKSVEDWRNVADRQVEDFRNLRSDLRHLREENERLRRQVGGASVVDSYADPYGPLRGDPYVARRSDPYAGRPGPYASDPYARRASEPYASRGDPYAVRNDPYARTIAGSGSGVRRVATNVHDVAVPRSYGPDDEDYNPTGARNVSDPYAGPSTRRDGGYHGGL